MIVLRYNSNLVLSLLFCNNIYIFFFLSNPAFLSLVGHVQVHCGV